jgi:RNA polymerase sigma-70 factor (ECF subfamily)
MPIETAALGPDSLIDFLNARDRLLSIAQHIAGGFTDADDIVQDVWLLWQRTDRSDVVNPRAFLSRTTSHLSISTIRSARRRPTIPAGSWLEGLGETDTDPARIAERADDLLVAIELLAVRLTPREQVVFVLREAFGWRYQRIAAGLGLTEAHTRQLSRRARIRLTTVPDNPVSTTSPTARQRLLGAFQDAAWTGDPAALLNLAGADR